MPRASKWLSIWLAFGLLLGPCLVYAVPSPSSSSVSLSPEEAAKIEAAIQAADQALQASSDKIAMQEKDLRTLWIFCGVLASAVVIRAAADVIQAIKD